MNLACKHKLALGFGIITAENKKQALERASVKKGNKGGQAAETCLQMIKIKKP
jgi:6,7-dimethyl-8-ribityllumazine synthase